jgi:hypothetical protein
VHFCSPPNYASGIPYLCEMKKFTTFKDASDYAKASANRGITVTVKRAGAEWEVVEERADVTTDLGNIEDLKSAYVEVSRKLESCLQKCDEIEQERDSLKVSLNATKQHVASVTAR